MSNLDNSEEIHTAIFVCLPRVMSSVMALLSWWNHEWFLMQYFSLYTLHQVFSPAVIASQAVLWESKNNTMFNWINYYWFGLLWNSPIYNSLFTLSSHQDIMNRENSTRLPYMQVEYIDDICYPLYKVSYFCRCCMCVVVCTKNTVVSVAVLLSYHLL